MDGAKRLGGAAAAAALLVSTALLAPATASPRTFVTKQTNTIAPGVTYTKITDPSVPLRTYVVTFEPSKAASLDVQAAGSTWGRYAGTSAIASSAGALAGINGDFTNNGMPVHAFGEEGSVQTAGANVGGTFAISKDEANEYLKSGVKPVVKVANTPAGKSFSVDQWNSGGPANGEVAAYSSFGGSVQKPPSNACSARLLPSGPYRWATGRHGITHDYAVDIVRCQTDPVPTNGGVVVSADRTSFRANDIKALKPGTDVTLSWDVDSWTGVTDFVGGAPQLLAGGRVVTNNNCGTYFCDRNPRAGIGYTADGRILLVVVDGRSSSSVGLTPVAFANTFRSLGATSALNLDGGGGATMWIKGKGVVNAPSDGSERPVTNAVLILPGADKNDPSSLRPSVVRYASPQRAADAEAASLADPASTGGLLETYGG
jgi:Phosphodiester glycosidase